MEGHKQRAVMFFHGLAGRRWCGGSCRTYGMPYLRHTLGAECRENKVPFFGMLYLRHIAGAGDLPLKPCAGQSGERKSPAAALPMSK